MGAAMVAATRLTRMGACWGMGRKKKNGAKSLRRGRTAGGGDVSPFGPFVRCIFGHRCSQQWVPGPLVVGLPSGLAKDQERLIR